MAIRLEMTTIAACLPKVCLEAHCVELCLREGFRIIFVKSRPRGIAYIRLIVNQLKRTVGIHKRTPYGLNSLTVWGLPFAVA
jgi:hypothetical protein